jgi:hypothetical protein
VGQFDVSLNWCVLQVQGAQLREQQLGSQRHIVRPEHCKLPRLVSVSARQSPLGLLACCVPGCPAQSVAAMVKVDFACQVVLVILNSVTQAAAGAGLGRLPFAAA